MGSRRAADRATLIAPRAFAAFATAAVSLFVAAACTAIAASGCRRAPPEGAAARARETFENRCATCHGTGGRGDGPASRGLSVSPRNYTDGAWQRGVTDEQIRAAIVKGGAAIGKSPAMPANRDLDPEVVDALVAIVRGFGAPAPATSD